MKQKLFLAGLLLISAQARAESPPFMTYLDVSFKSISVTSGSECLIFFREVAVTEDLKDVSVNIDSVTVLLIQSSNSYTTIDLHNALKNSDGWIIAQRAVIVVRQKADLETWRKFLLKKKAERDAWRKQWFEPTRVLPPEE